MDTSPPGCTREAKSEATFFVLGKHVDRHGSIVRDIYQAGHAIGNHSYDHPFLDDPSVDVRAQLERCQRAIENAIGVSAQFFRAPYGRVDDRVRRITSDMFLTMVGWSADGSDWDRPPAQAAVVATRIMKHINSRSQREIVLLHDASPEAEDRSASVEAARILVANYSALGRRFVSIREIPGIERAAFYGC